MLFNVLSGNKYSMLTAVYDRLNSLEQKFNVHSEIVCQLHKEVSKNYVQSYLSFYKDRTIFDRCSRYISVILYAYERVLLLENIYFRECFTFLAIMIPEGLWMTFMTTPPFPAPSSPSFSKSFSWVSSPTCCFWVRNVSRRSLCCSLISSSFTFCCKSCRSMPLISVLGFLQYRKCPRSMLS